MSQQTKLNGRQGVVLYADWLSRALKTESVARNVAWSLELGQMFDTARKERVCEAILDMAYRCDDLGWIKLAQGINWVS